jgi:glycosyltransferase involved in cell wall biosynthesis
LEGLISIIIPVFNSERFLEETLRSIVNQTSTSFECIIVDDGSTDGSARIVNNYMNKHNCFRYVKRNERYAKGGNGARNMGASLASYKWLVFLDSDDILKTDFIESRIFLVSSLHQKVDFIANLTGSFYYSPGDCDVIWNVFDKVESRKKLVSRFLKLDIPWQTSAITWNSSFFNSILGFDESLKVWQDWEIHIRALLHTDGFILNPKVDYFYRRYSPGSIANRNQEMTYKREVVRTILRVHQNPKLALVHKIALFRLLVMKGMYVDHFKSNIKSLDLLVKKLKRGLQKSKASLTGFTSRLIFKLIAFDASHKHRIKWNYDK